ncbi:hypothetical protein RRG08_039096 [Elysia crispata]|uniref:Uncharacterized protein n=1 Tax=Elysia crispata TaxID=231223 RepID=A0AAE0ZN77_9GAST|nr:hypothetical protein RRG08_039096 [Elysia crispata]
MKAWLIFSVCIVASFFMVSESARSMADQFACKNLYKCAMHLETISWTLIFRFDTVADSRESWVSDTLNLCRNRRKELACTLKKTCDHDVSKKHARWARKLVRSLCKPEGKEIARRLFAQGTSPCLGNDTVFYLFFRNMGACIKAHFPNPDRLTESEQCIKLNDVRNCNADYSAAMCTDLFRWYVDKYWEIKGQVYYKHCKGTFTPPLYKLPGYR